MSGGPYHATTQFLLIYRLNLALRISFVPRHEEISTTNKRADASARLFVIDILLI